MTMDKVRFSCPRCQTIMQTGAEKIGYDVACPHCAHRFRLVESSDSASNSGPPSGGDRSATLPPSKSPTTRENPVTQRPASSPSEPIPGSGKPPAAFSNHGSQAPVIGRVPAPQPGFACPYCGTHSPPIWKSEVSTIGWIVFAVLFVTTCVFCFIGLFIRDRYRVCSNCKIRLG